MNISNISADTTKTGRRFGEPESEVDKGAHTQVYKEFRDWEYSVKTPSRASWEREDCGVEHRDRETEGGLLFYHFIPCIILFYILYTL